MTAAHNSEQKTIYNIYAIFGVSIVLSVVPMASAALISMLFFLIALIAAYYVRSKSDAHSLAENHMTFIIRSIWIVGAISFLTTLAASLYMIPKVNYSYFQSCADNIAGIGLEAAESMGMEALYSYAEPCITDFINGNYTVFVTSMLIAGAPLVLYLAYRFIKGLSRAFKGYRLADPKAWF